MSNARLTPQDLPDEGTQEKALTPLAEVPNDDGATNLASTWHGCENDDGVSALNPTEGNASGISHSTTAKKVGDDEPAVEGGNDAVLAALSYLETEAIHNVTQKRVKGATIICTSITVLAESFRSMSAELKELKAYVRQHKQARPSKPSKSKRAGEEAPTAESTSAPNSAAQTVDPPSQEVRSKKK